MYNVYIYNIYIVGIYTRALRQVGRLLHERLQGGIPQPRPDHGLEFFDDSDADSSDSGLSDILLDHGLGLKGT